MILELGLFLLIIIIKKKKSEMIRVKEKGLRVLFFMMLSLEGPMSPFWLLLLLLNLV